LQPRSVGAVAEDPSPFSSAPRRRARRRGAFCRRCREPVTVPAPFRRRRHRPCRLRSGFHLRRPRRIVAAPPVRRRHQLGVTVFRPVPRRPSTPPDPRSHLLGQGREPCQVEERLEQAGTAEVPVLEVGQHPLPGPPRRGHLPPPGADRAQRFLELGAKRPQPSRRGVPVDRDARHRRHGRRPGVGVGEDRGRHLALAEEGVGCARGGAAQKPPPPCGPLRTQEPRHGPPQRDQLPPQPPDRQVPSPARSSLPLLGTAAGHVGRDQPVPESLDLETDGTHQLADPDRPRSGAFDGRGRSVESVGEVAPEGLDGEVGAGEGDADRRGAAGDPVLDGGGEGVLGLGGHLDVMVA